MGWWWLRLVYSLKDFSKLLWQLTTLNPTRTRAVFPPLSFFDGKPHPSWYLSRLNIEILLAPKGIAGVIQRLLGSASEDYAVGSSVSCVISRNLKSIDMIPSLADDPSKSESIWSIRD